MDITAIVDRIEEDTQAVLLVGQEQTELIVEVSRLPQGIKDGTCLRLVMEDNQLIQATIDHEQTERLAEEIREKMLQLKQKGRRLKPL